MPNISQAKLDETVAAAVALALATANAERDNNRGALWLAKPESKTDLNGRLTVDSVEYAICAYETGADGSDKRPIYRLSVFKSEDAKS